jgi:hypothetical protein
MAVRITICKERSKVLVGDLVDPREGDVGRTIQWMFELLQLQGTLTSILDFDVSTETVNLDGSARGGILASSGSSP